MEWKKLAVGAVLYAVAALVVYNLGAFLDMKYYVDPANAGLWSQIMMPNGGAPGLNFAVLSIIISVRISSSFSIVFPGPMKKSSKETSLLPATEQRIAFPL